MPYIELNTARKALLVSIGITLALIPASLIPLMFLREAVLSLKPIGMGIRIFTSIKVNILLTLSLLMIILPYTIVDFLNRRYIDMIDKSLPVFFKGMSEAIRSGLTFIEALRHVSLTLGGPLSREVNKALVRVELGGSLEDSLELIIKRIRLPTLQRAVVVLRTAYESGGKVMDVLETAADVYARLREFKEEKNVVINPHSVTIYIATLIYLFLIFVLLYAFIYPIGRLSGAAQFIGTIDPEIYKAIFYYSAVIEALFGGLIVGKMKQGQISGGLIHVVIQLFIVIIFFWVMDMYGNSIAIIPLR